MRNRLPDGIEQLGEPMVAGKFDGYAHLRATGVVPIANGENMPTLAEFRALVTSGGVDFDWDQLDRLRADP